MVLPLALLLFSLFLVAFGLWLTARRMGHYRWEAARRRQKVLSDLTRMVVGNRREKAGVEQSGP